jgi:hypothetical protein
MKTSRLFAALILAAGGIWGWRARTRTAPDARGFVDGIPALTPDMRLVVARLDFTKTVSAESPKVAWGVDWGTTRAVLSVPVRVHYAVDLSGPRPVEFRPGRGKKTLVAVFPDPQVQAVEVFADGERAVVSPGWARLEACSGRALLDRLDRGVYDAAKTEASSPDELALAKGEARPELTRLLESYLKESGSRARAVVVQFRSDAADTAAAAGPVPPDGPGI